MGLPSKSPCCEQSLPAYADAQPWIEACLLAHGMHLTSVTNISRYDFAVIDKVFTENGHVYFKAGNAQEAVITAQIERDHTGLAPKVLGHDATNDWLLTQDGGDKLSDVADLKCWQLAAQKLGRFHKESTPATFRSVGCPEHSFSGLVDDYRHFLDQDSWLSHWEIGDEQLFALRAALPRLRAAHGNIQKLSLPLCCCHGDAQPMNCLSGVDGIAWFDWREAAIAHPFTDIGWMLAWLLPKRPTLAIEVTEVKLQALLESYCEGIGIPVSDFSVEDTMLLAMAHRVLVYHRQFYQWPGTKPYYVTYYLRRLAKMVKP